MITDDPVEPELAKENVVNRMVLVPAMSWPGLSEHGWVAKVTKLDSRTSICSLKLHVTAPTTSSLPLFSASSRSREAGQAVRPCRALFWRYLIHY